MPFSEDPSGHFIHVSVKSVLGSEAVILSPKSMPTSNVGVVDKGEGRANVGVGPVLSNEAWMVFEAKVGVLSSGGSALAGMLTDTLTPGLGRVTPVEKNVQPGQGPVVGVNGDTGLPWAVTFSNASCSSGSCVSLPVWMPTTRGSVVSFIGTETAVFLVEHNGPH